MIANRVTSVRPLVDEFRSSVAGGRPLLLTNHGSVSWVTGGLSDVIDRTTQVDPVWCLVGDRGTTLLTTNVEAPRIATEHDLDALGFSLVGVPWYEPDALADAVRALAGDGASAIAADGPGWDLDLNAQIRLARMVLTDPEVDAMRDLGSLAAHALESALHRWEPGVTTDFQIAADISHALEAQGAQAVCLIVGADQRVRDVRHPMAIGAIAQEMVMAVVVARRAGLHVAATRIGVVHDFDDVFARLDQLNPVMHQLLSGSVPGKTWSELYDLVGSAYSAAGLDQAWREHYQGGPIAFDQREFEFVPGAVAQPFADAVVQPNTAVAWNPSCRGGAKIEDTYLVGEQGLEWITRGGAWPKVGSPDGQIEWAGVEVVA